VALRTETLQLELAERRRRERDLHDTCQQRAVVVAAKLGLLADVRESNIEASVAEVADAAEQLAASIRHVVEGRSPLSRVDGGLTSALYAEAAAVAVSTDIVDQTSRRYPAAVEEHVYACCLEAIHNAVAHARPSRIVVRLDELDGLLRFEVADDGTGFDTTLDAEGHGLGNLRSRVSELGGHLSIRSDHSGTSVSAVVPVGEVPA
jgi:signal transduction histidine kinase